MTDSKPVKVLCAGDVQGAIAKLIKQVQAVNAKVKFWKLKNDSFSKFKKITFLEKLIILILNRVTVPLPFQNGPFDMLLCVGEFFGPSDEENQKVVSGEIEMPIATYILGEWS